jgi:hypothetical protein
VVTFSFGDTEVMAVALSRVGFDVGPGDPDQPLAPRAITLPRLTLRELLGSGGPTEIESRVAQWLQAGLLQCALRFSTLQGEVLMHIRFQGCAVVRAQRLVFGPGVSTSRFGELVVETAGLQIESLVLSGGSGDFLVEVGQGSFRVEAVEGGGPVLRPGGTTVEPVRLSRIERSQGEGLLAWLRDVLAQDNAHARRELVLEDFSQGPGGELARFFAAFPTRVNLFNPTRPPRPPDDRSPGIPLSLDITFQADSMSISIP